MRDVELAHTHTCHPEEEAWDVSKLGCCYSEWLLRQCASTCDKWLRMHELALVRRTMGW